MGGGLGHEKKMYLYLSTTSLFKKKIKRAVPQCKYFEEHKFIVYRLEELKHSNLFVRKGRRLIVHMSLEKL